VTVFRGAGFAPRPIMPIAAHAIAWRHDFDGALADAKAQRKPVLLDFSAAPM
jgi:hypothetical protein